MAWPMIAVSNTALVRDLCAVVADLGAPPSAVERCWTALRLVLLLAQRLDLAPGIGGGCQKR